MIAINRDNGTVTWGEYVLYSGLRHDTFVQHYPHFTPVQDIHTPDGRRERRYCCPTIDFDIYPLTLDVDYFNQRLSGIYMRRGGKTASDEENDLWWRELPGWVRVAQNWLITQLGQPHVIEPGVLYYEERFMTPEEIQLLQIWSYNFAWGKTGFYYDKLFQPGDIYVHYDYHQQIKTWDELTAECDILLQNQLQQNGMYIANLVATRALIDMVRPHFDFQKAKPYVGSRGLAFPLTEWDTIVVVDVRPDDLTKRYKISRHDTTKKMFIADGDHSRLIEDLRMFLETERM